MSKSAQRCKCACTASTRWARKGWKWFYIQWIIINTQSVWKELPDELHMYEASVKSQGLYAPVSADLRNSYISYIIYSLWDYHSWGQWCIANFKVQKCKSMLVSGHYCGMGIIKHWLIEISSRWLQFYCPKTIIQLQKRVRRHDIIKAVESDSGERLLVFETQPQVGRYRCFAGGSDQTPNILDMIQNLQSTIFL